MITPFPRLPTGGKPCWVRREDRGQAGEDHRWLRRYGCDSIYAAFSQSLQSWFLSLCLLFSFPICTSLHFSHLPALSLLTDVQTNCTIRSWNTRLSARSWIMPSMIWTPCNAALRIFALAAALLIWRLLFLLFSLIYPKCTIKLFFSCTLSSFFLSIYCLLEFLSFFTI